MRIRLYSGSSGPYAENAWTARFSGPRPTWRRSCSISNITIMSIARTPDAKGTLRCRVSTQITDEQISVAIDGRGIVEVILSPDCRVRLSTFATDSHWKHGGSRSGTSVRPSEHGLNILNMDCEAPSHARQSTSMNDHSASRISRILAPPYSGHPRIRRPLPRNS